MVEHDTPATSQHPPTEGEAAGAESREETLARVVAENVAPEPVAGATLSEDPSHRRGLARVLTARWIGVGALVGLIAGAILAFATWPFITDGVVGGDVGRISLAIALVIAGTLIGGVLSGLVNLAREDGRVQREVEDVAPEAGRGPGKGSDPSLDPPRDE